METSDLSEGAAVEVVDGVYLAQLAVGEEMSIQHVHVEPGGEVPEHDHHHEQLGFVYDGALTFRVGGEEVVVGTGESYALASHEPHGVANEGDDAARAIDIFSPPRPNPDWAGE